MIYFNKCGNWTVCSVRQWVGRESYNGSDRYILASWHNGGVTTDLLPVPFFLATIHTLCP